jgi:hypothetical protein
MADVDQRPDRLGLWVAIWTAVLAAISLVMAVTTLPRSGPYCQSGCVGYPYTDAAAFVPRDYFWMYPAIVLTLLALLLVECIHSQLPPSRELLSRIGVAFTIMGGAILVVDYAIQLTFIQLALLIGETEGLSPWTRYNPHGIFIALENVGYALFNVAYVFIGVAMLRMPTRLWRAAGWIFALGGALTVMLLVFYGGFYRVRLDYRFEVTAILITWLVLIVAPVLLSIAFLRRREPVSDQRTRHLEIFRS